MDTILGNSLVDSIDSRLTNYGLRIEKMEAMGTAGVDGCIRMYYTTLAHAFPSRRKSQVIKVHLVGASHCRLGQQVAANPCRAMGL